MFLSIWICRLKDLISINAAQTKKAGENTYPLLQELS
jgi:hypothetical protein